VGRQNSFKIGLAVEDNKTLPTFDELRFIIYLQLDLQLDLHELGKCEEDCYVCREQYEIEHYWEYDTLLVEHEESHNRRWDWPYISQEWCEYCRMDYILIKELKTNGN
jgi:hypothetical protein